MARILITVPTWNEAPLIERNLMMLRAACDRLFDRASVTIEVADNGSTDGTGDIVRRLENETIKLLSLNERGKGHAIRRSWTSHRDEYDVYVFLDADLAADVNDLPNLIDPILTGRADLVCGSRFLKGATVERTGMRTVASHAYRFLQSMILNLPVQDAQCGFKAASRRMVASVIPECVESGWMFDSELIARAKQKGMGIQEIPISWIEDRSPNRRSALTLWKDGFGFLTGLFRIRKQLGFEPN